jgi:hypothetical protein
MNYTNKCLITITPIYTHIKLTYNNNNLLYIPSNLINFNKNKYTFNMTRPLKCEYKEIVWNVDDISKIKINITKNNYELLNDYIYKYHLTNENKTNIYYINKNKFAISEFSKTLNSCWFINNLFHNCK